MSRIKKRKAKQSKAKQSKAMNNTTTTSCGSLAKSIGERLSGSSFSNYQATTLAQQEAVSRCRRYADKFETAYKGGHNLMLLGPCGTGKDHLMVATIAMIVKRYPRLGNKIRFAWGNALTQRFQDAATGKSQENYSRLVELYSEPHLLCISDPAPASGDLSDFRKQVMVDLVDERYRRKKPIAMTINVANRSQLAERIGDATTDRILHGAMKVICDWPSFRATDSCFE